LLRERERERERDSERERERERGREREFLPESAAAFWERSLTLSQAQLPEF